MPKVINVPIEAMQLRRRDKRRLECLACSVLIKAAYQTSVLYLNVTHVMDVLGVSYRKAVKLIEWLKEDDFFIYNERKNCVFAKPLRSGVHYRYGRRNGKKHDAVADTCEKVRVGDGSTLRKVTSELRNKLLINAIRNHERDNFIVGDNSTVTKHDVRLAISLRKLGGCFGLSKSSAGRYIDILADTGRVSKSEIVAECVVPELNDATEREWYADHPKAKLHAWHSTVSGGWSGWVVYGRVYSVLRREDVESCKHVIWNHAGRVGQSCHGYLADGHDGGKAWEKHCKCYAKNE